MKHIIGVIAILQLVTARPQNNNDIKIISYENVSDERGNFKFAFETSNGITQQQSGEMKIVNSTTNSTVMRGAYSVIAPDNSMHEVKYISDENGYQSRFSIAAPSLSLLTRTSDKQDDKFVLAEEQKADKNGTEPRPGFIPLVSLQGNTSANSTNQTASKEFPDRIGTPAIITLMGPPG